MKWNHIIVAPQKSVLHALRIIDNGAMQIALVVDGEQRLLGTITDGDIRRGILKGVSLEESVVTIMNSNPIVGYAGETQEQLIKRMILSRIRHLPVVNHRNQLVDFEIYQDITTFEEKENAVVIMAGGLGTRLRPLTDRCPKPLLRVGGKPLLETILDNFKMQGFRKFYFSVNYKADMIINYFGNGSSFGVDIHYLHESERMGTAGALTLLPGKQTAPLIVMNGDLLTKINYSHLLQFHHDQNSHATMCLRDYELQIPYGVVEVDQQKLIGLKEKPIYRYFVNAGIYVLNPEVLDLLPQNTYFDMTYLFEKLIAQNYETSAFPIREYWIDIGKLDDFDRANSDFTEVFG